MPRRITMRSAVLIAVVGAALALVIGVDVWGARSAGHASTQILEDATRSIALVEDMRWQLHRLAHIGSHPAEPIQPIVDKIEADMAAYTPLATFDGEPAMWAKTEDEIVLTLDAYHRGDLAGVQQRSEAIFASIDSLIDINSRESRELAGQMVSERHIEIVSDIAAVLAASIVITLLFLRVWRLQARERELVKDSLQRAEDRNRELDAFAGRAAHDLRAPLNPIRGFAELIATDTSTPPDTRRQASMITKGVLRMTRVIDDMLALSRAGHPEPGTASVALVVANVRDELAAELADGALVVDADEVTVGCNEISLELLIRNLVGNAAKYRSSERALEVHVTAKRDGDAVEIAVSDNGTGIDPETRAHAFDPFYRGRKDIAGTGLGLSIVERLTRAYGGSCRIDPERTLGTRVVIRLPAATA